MNRGITMQFTWNANTVGWFKAASAYTGFHEKLAERLLPVIAGSETLFDIGCGLGLLSQQWRDSVGKIVCVDINEAALASLTEDIAAKQIGNIEVRLNDAFDSEPWCDVILLSYFGSLSAERFLPYCRKLIVIADWDEGSNLTGRSGAGAGRVRLTAGKLEERLSESGVRYSLKETALEFGQPFVSREDAADFYGQHGSRFPAGAEAFLNRIVPVNRPPYRFYLPYLKRMGVFVIEGERSTQKAGDN
ncbi:methyltransferase domain-containing protein [Paenibacillus macerans]|uniref:Methyltransferase domain-containing protein n=2 Tax=Paenibacillus macerans TaxID=44252 RepID=A0A6N8F5S7_PAEMA|nr:methyltransferase domain-containing protein [Paenibacillus macerans]